LKLRAGDHEHRKKKKTKIRNLIKKSCKKTDAVRKLNTRETMLLKKRGKGRVQKNEDMWWVIGLSVRRRDQGVGQGGSQEGRRPEKLTAGKSKGENSGGSPRGRGKKNVIKLS